MKNFFVPRRWLAGAFVVVMLTLTGPALLAQSQPIRLRVGVYDSRAVVVAYCNTPELRDTMKEVKADYEKAKAAKDEKRMKDIEARMKTQQRTQHEQGFSTASVASILVKVEPSLAAVAEQAGVQMIVSQWEVNYRAPAVEVVDVTDLVVGLFNPDERALKQIEELRSKPPVAVERLRQ